MRFIALLPLLATLGCGMGVVGSGGGHGSGGKYASDGHEATSSPRASAPAMGPSTGGAVVRPLSAHMPARADLASWLAPVLAGGFVHGMVVGEIDASGPAVYGFGTVGDAKAPPTGDTLFQIDSVTKTFTGLLLANEVVAGRMALDDAVQSYLPASVAVPTFGSGGAITLLDLATHTSGLPETPSNFYFADPANPFADYGVTDLYAFLDGYTLPYAPGTKLAYSNVGVGLLGLALARLEGRPYEDAIEQSVLRPLGLDDTAVSLTPEQQARVAPAHDGDLASAPAWSFTDALVGAGGLWSTANDMLAYLAAQAGLRSTPLDDAVALSHVVRFRDPDYGQGVGLNWLVESDDFVFHNGSSYGYTSFAGFDPVRHAAVVVLCDTGTLGTPTPVWTDLTTTLGFLVLKWAQGTPPPDLASLLPAEASLTNAQLDALAGDYAVSGRDGPLHVERRGSALVADAPWLWFYPLRFYPTSQTTLQARVTAANLSFTLDGEGKAVAIQIVENGQTYAGKRN